MAIFNSTRNRWLIDFSQKNCERSRWGLNLKFPSRFQLSILKFPCFHVPTFRLARPLTLWPGRRRCQGCEELSPTKPQKLPLIFVQKKKFGNEICLKMQDEWISGSKDNFSVWERHSWKKCFSFNGWLVAYNPSVWTACHQRSLLVILLSLCFWETDQCWLGLLTPRAKQWKTVGFREGQAFSAAFATKVTRVQLTRLKGAFACGNSCGP